MKMRQTQLQQLRFGLMRQCHILILYAQSLKRQKSHPYFLKPTNQCAVGKASCKNAEMIVPGCFEKFIFFVEGEEGIG